MRQFICLSMLAIFLLCGCGHGIAARVEGIADILSFTNEEYFGLDETVLGPRESRLLDMDFMGVAVNAPRKIETGSRDKLPLVMAVRSDGDRGWEVELRKNCILVGTDMNDGTVHFTNALADEKELKSRGRKEKKLKGPKPSGLASAAAQLTELDARERLKMKWDTGTWSLGVINYDRTSNTVVVDLAGDKEAGTRPARAVSPEPSPSGTGGLPCYLPTADTPPSPQSGVVFTAELSGEQGEQHLKILGAFTITVRDMHVPRQKVVHMFQEGRKENVAAVVPMTLALVGLDWEKPLRFDWVVPVYGAQLSAGMPAKGYFSIDAFASGSAGDLGPGKYACYLIIDGRIYGPEMIRVPGRADTIKQ